MVSPVVTETDFLLLLSFSCTPDQRASHEEKLKEALVQLDAETHFKFHVLSVAQEDYLGMKEIVGQSATTPHSLNDLERSDLENGADLDNDELSLRFD